MSFTFFLFGIFGFLGRAKRAYNTDFSFFMLALRYHGGGVSYLLVLSNLAFG
jgi:hypothetical protein